MNRLFFLGKVLLGILILKYSSDILKNIIKNE